MYCLRPQQRVVLLRLEPVGGLSPDVYKQAQREYKITPNSSGWGALKKERSGLLIGVHIKLGCAFKSLAAKEANAITG